MMNDLIKLPAASAVPALPTVYELGSMSNEQLRGELARALTLTAAQLRYLAVIWRELERRGEDLSELRTGLAIYLPQIAAGQLTPDAVIRFAGQPSVLRAIATLPTDEQERMARGETVDVLTVGEDGSYSAVPLPAHTLTPAQARLVVGPGKLRSPTEQRAVLESARLAASQRQLSRAVDAPRVRYDPKTDKIRVGKTSASVAEVVKALAAAASMPSAEAELEKTVLVKLTAVEHKGINIRAAQAGMTQQDYCRMLLLMQSLIA